MLVMVKRGALAGARRVYTHYHDCAHGLIELETVLTERHSTVSPLSPSEPRDRCRFGREFDHTTVGCPAFQRTQFIASTSYGKPLGLHVACSHLVVGEL